MTDYWIGKRIVKTRRKQDKYRNECLNIASRLSLTLIVKSAASDLAACLLSVAGFAAEVIVADTGSTDGRPAVEARRGAGVVDFPRCDT